MPINKPIPIARLVISILVITVINNGCSKNAPTSTANNLSIVTLAASSISYTGAVSGGIIKPAATDTLMQKGICYGTTALPTIADSILVSATLSDSFTCMLKGLSPNTGYFIRAFVKTQAGISYGNQIVIKTAGEITSGGTPARVYLSGGYSNDLFAIDAATGKILWNKKISSTYCSSAIYSNGTVVVKGDNNSLTAFDTLGNVRWTRALDGSNNDARLVPPIANNGVLYIRDLQYTYAIYSADGSLKWRSDNPSSLAGDGTLTLINNTIYARTEYNSLSALDAETGVFKWTVDYYAGAMAIFSDAVYLFNSGSGTTVYSFDRNMGKLNWTSKEFPVQGNSQVNAKYGRIYNSAGWVMDSASLSAANATILPPMKFYSGSATAAWTCPQGGVYPILADGLAIMPVAVCDANTGDLICTLPGYRGGYQGFCGAAYLNHVLYYTTGQYEVFDPNIGGHYYSDLYAYDVIAKKMLWDAQIENTDLFNVEPCVIDQSGTAYRGAFTFK